jgi:hypothetical protein
MGIDRGNAHIENSIFCKMNFLKNIKKIKSEVSKWNPSDIKKETIYIVSYPKSGNTWMRFIIGNYLTDCDMDFSNFHKVIPDIHKNPEDIANVKFNPIFIKSHFPYREEYKKVIYIFRDGRDVSVSYYHHLLGKKRIPEQTSFNEYFYNYFITGRVHFGDWGDHIKSWLIESESKKGIFYTSYERFQEDIFKEMCNVLKFSNMDIKDDRLLRAINCSSKENMMNDEKNNRNNSIVFKNTNSESDYKFIRKGIIGDWKEYYDKKMNQVFCEKYGKILNDLGYECD